MLSGSGGKNLEAILRCVAPCADEIYLTRADAVRSLEPGEVAAALRAAGATAAIHAVPNPFLALQAAREGLGPDDLLCATGSVYLAGIARRVLGGER